MNPVQTDSRHRDWVRSARRQVDAADTRADSTATGGAPRRAAVALPPDFLPGYVLERELGRGGQGVVCLGVQKSTGQRVALKVLRDSAFSGPLERARFEREVQILAALRHPNIVTIYDCGTVGANPYLVMDYIEGQPLDEYVGQVEKSKGRKVETSELLRLFATICEAVNAAHLRGVIHRDLKPSNIRVDGGGAPHILDFGLARMTDDPESIRNPQSAIRNLTVTGQFVGSLPWAAPEQVEGDSHDIDTRTDVYALGVILYQLLTRRFPYPVVGRVRVVMDHIRESPPANPRAPGRQIDDELATLVLKCLAKERERRYQTAGELARDLRRYLADEPIEAKRDSGWYVVRKTLRRHRRGVFVAAAFALLVTVGAIVLSVLYARQGRLLVEVEEQRDRAEYESFVANIAAAGAAIVASDGGAALARLQTIPAELRNWEWHYLVRQADQSVATWYGPKELITGRVRLSPDGRYVGASFWMEERNGALRVWSRTSQHPAAEFTSSGSWVPFEFLGGGEQLLVCDRDGAVSRFDLADRREVEHRRLTALDPGETAMEFSPDGRILAIFAGQGLRLWDTVADLLLHELALSGDRSVNILSFDAGGKRLAVGLNDGTIVLWDVASARALAQTKAHAGQFHGVAFSPDGGLLATAGGEGDELKLWDLTEHAAPPETTTNGHAPSLRMIRELHDGGQRNGAISFSPDDKLLAAPSEDKTVRIWNVAEGEVRTTLLGHTTGVGCTDFSSDGRFVVSGAREGEVKLWDLEKSPPVRALRELPGQLASVAFTADGAKLLLQSGTTACVVDFASGRWLQQRTLFASPILGGMLPGPSGSEATYSDPDGSIHIWETGSGEESRVIGVHKSIPRLAGDPSRRVLASADAEAVILWDWAEGRESRRFVGPGDEVRSLALSYDASRLAIGLKTGELIICDARTGQRTPVERAHSGSVGSAAFSPDGRNLATGSEDGTVKLWDVATGRVVWSASPQLGDVWCVAFSPDGTRLAAGGRDRSVRLFDPATGRELLALRGPTGTVMCVAFSPDGNSIAAGSWAREVFIWDASQASDPPGSASRRVYPGGLGME